MALSTAGAYYPGQQQMVLTQPSVQYVTPVLTQPVAAPAETPKVPKAPREWTSGLGSCLEDCKNCLYVSCCYCCASCSLLTSMGENRCLWCFTQNWITPVRTKLRMKLNIKGSICNDWCVACFCTPCALCQMMREVKDAKKKGEKVI